MEHAIRSRYNDAILHEAMSRYGIAPDQITLLDGFESFIYEFRRDDGEYILRIGHSLRRTPDLIQGEVDWINYLAAGSAGVAKAILSQSGDLVERIADGNGGEFLATAFIKAPGRTLHGATDWTEERYEIYGTLLGRIHALSQKYTVPNPAWKRPEWDDESNMFIGWLPDSEAIAAEKFRQTLAYLLTLPCTPETYGMIHQDAHSGNFFVDDQNHFTLFDFDDCCYGHYVYDIAMVVFYMVTLHPDPVGLMRDFMPAFWRGYHRENPSFDAALLAEVPPFLKLREIDLYGVLHRSYDDVNNIPHTWPREYMKGRKQRIETDIPVVEFDFAAFGHSVK
jgi:Ser/Thr protein kinase RdoA (MazF antagonist)